MVINFTQNSCKTINLEIGSIFILSFKRFVIIVYTNINRNTYQELDRRPTNIHRKSN